MTKATHIKNMHRTAIANPHIKHYRTTVGADRYRGHRTVEAQYVRECIADDYAADRAVRAWLRSNGLDPLRLGVAFDVDYSRRYDADGDGPDSISIDVLHVLPGATGYEDEVCEAAWSLGSDVDTIVYADGTYAR